MARNTESSPMSRCQRCGFEAASGGSEWDTVESPPIGELTQCPECGSTDVMTGLSISG
jgi:DNA-directed RNA polymerase subunit RPC12/RpoP